MPATLWLGFWSVIIALGAGVPLGLYAGLRANTLRDYTASGFGIVWRAMPNFWLAVIISGLITAGGALEFYRTAIVETPVSGTPDALNNLFTTVDIFAGVPYLELLFIPVPNLGPMFVAFKWILPAALVLGSSSMGNEVRIGRTAVLESINSQSTSRPRRRRGSPPGSSSNTSDGTRSSRFCPSSWASSTCWSAGPSSLRRSSVSTASATSFQRGVGARYPARDGTRVHFHRDPDPVQHRPRPPVYVHRSANQPWRE